MITILGPTASGKTRLAALVASNINGEVISADSRQVYRGMDLGTGKDYADYLVDGKKIPVHLIDIVEPGYEYNVYEYQRDFTLALQEIDSRGKIPVLCGGTGLYLEAVLKGYHLLKVPVNNTLREELTHKTGEELSEYLALLRPLHNVSDTSDRERLVRAIEIQTFYRSNSEMHLQYPEIQSVIFGIHFERQAIRQRITERLQKRLESGMVEEVQQLLATGLPADKIKFYGLEYRFLTQYILGEIDYERMFQLLNTAIHQFAKRQMTWFRRMERSGIKIHWIDGTLQEEEKVQIVMERVNNFV